MSLEREVKRGKSENLFKFKFYPGVQILENIQTDGRIDKSTEGRTGQINGQILVKQLDTQANTVGWTDDRMGEHTNGWTDRQKDRWTDRQIDR
jgi:hypothetical protein